MKEKGVNDVVDGAHDMLNFVVLLRGVGALHVEDNTMREKKGANNGIVKLLTVVTLHTFDSGTELGANKIEKVCNSRERVEFKMEGESPQVMVAIIKNSMIIFEP